MTEELRSWIKENQTLVYFLIGQLLAICATVISITAYMVRLEARVATLETRGSPHLGLIDNRLTVLESMTKDNHDRIERVVDIMTRELNKPK